MCLASVAKNDPSILEAMVLVLSIISFKDQPKAVFPPSQFLLTNHQFVGSGPNNFFQYHKHSVRKIEKFVKI